jgi:para-nitrobenzyl esterase
MKKTEIIETRNGKIQGYIGDGLQIFKGIPYTEPPIGHLRLNTPEPKNPWEGVLEALEYKPVSPQPPPITSYFPPPPQSEEKCLNLNVWTPGCDDKKRPVMFWIHGGSHIYGSGQILNGRTLSQRGDIVLVTINYRLGPLGYLFIPGAPSNIGQLDQIEALKWVRDNIGFFGGNPDDVTIFGESAGATSICALMAMPKAKGLFHKAVSQSSVTNPDAFDFSVRKATAEALFEELNLKTDDLEGYRKLSVKNIIDALIKAQAKVLTSGNQLDFKPWVDGETLPEHPTKAIEKGFAKDIELLIGTNLEEWRFWRAFEPNFEDHPPDRIKKRIINLLTSIGEEENKLPLIIDTYKKSREDINHPINIHEVYEAYLTDSIFRISSIKFAEAQRKNQNNTFMYLFNWKTPFDNGRYGAMHAMEIAFVFGSFWEDFLFTFIKKTPETKVLSEKMMDAWLSFVKIGDPNHPNIPKWPSYDEKKRSTMVFDNKIEVWDDPLSKEREMWNNLNIWRKF